jgi:2'-5' RNA ligase
MNPDLIIDVISKAWAPAMDGVAPEKTEAELELEAAQEAWENNQTPETEEALREARAAKKRDQSGALERPEIVEKGGQHSGIMIALQVPSLVANMLAVPGGEAPERLHVTLAYVPGAAEDTEMMMRIMAAISPLAQTLAPLKGWIGGTGRFLPSESSDGKSVFYASFNSPGLEALRHAVVSALEALDVPISRAHGYTPHITLAYVEPEAADPVSPIGGLPTFEMDAMILAANELGNLFPFLGTIVLKGSPTSSQVHVNVPLGGEKKKKLAESMEPPEVNNLEVKMLDAATGEDDEEEDETVVKAIIRKMDRMKQIVYGVVLTPNEIDDQEDWMTPEDIEDTAHRYLIKSRVVGKNHSHVAGAVPVESFIAPADFYMDGGPYGPQLVKKGAWVLAVKVQDSKEWERVMNGDYQAFSVGGFGARD